MTCIEENNIPRSINFPAKSEGYVVLRVDFREGYDLTDFHLDKLPNYYVKPTFEFINATDIKISYKNNSSYEELLNHTYSFIGGWGTTDFRIIIGPSDTYLGRWNARNAYNVWNTFGNIEYPS